MDDTVSANEPTEQILNQNNTAAQSNKIVEGMESNQRERHGCFTTTRFISIPGGIR
jgi:hypothetical protein